MKTARENCNAFVDKALSYVGYRSQPLNVNTFSERRQLKGQPWDGMFIDTVAKEVGLRMPSFTYAPLALSHYLKRARVFLTPQRGDIVFFEFSTDKDFGVPHVGIVTDVSNFKTDKTFKTVEAMVSNGMPKSQQVNDGVYERARHVIEVIGFARPVFGSTTARDKPAKSQTDDASSSLNEITVGQLRTGSTHKNVQTVQHALSMLTGITGMSRGRFCRRTKLAYAKFQRDLGYPNSAATGDVDAFSLERLANESRLFTFKP